MGRATVQALNIVASHSCTRSSLFSFKIVIIHFNYSVIMIPVAFDYQRAVTVDEAIAALSSGDGKILAGGHSLLPAMKLRLNQPAKLVDISKIDALKGIKEEDGEIVIGAGTTHGTIASDDLIKSKLPFFATTAALIGDVQVRNHGTIGGSLAHADPLPIGAR